MHLVIVLESAQLASSNDADAQSLTGGVRRGYAANAIMVGESYRRELAPLGGFDYSLGRKSSVRRCGVCMQVDKRRPARIVAHCS